MTQPPQDSDFEMRTDSGGRRLIAALVEAQIKIASGLTIHGLIAGIAMAMGVPLVVINLAPVNEWLSWVVVWWVAITDAGIIITTLAVGIVSCLRTSHGTMRMLEQDCAA